MIDSAMWTGVPGAGCSEGSGSAALAGDVPSRSESTISWLLAQPRDQTDGHCRQSPSKSSIPSPLRRSERLLRRLTVSASASSVSFGSLGSFGSFSR